MKTVTAIDSSALVKYFSREEDWKKVEEEILKGTISLDLAIKEVANALWKKTLNKEIRLEDAEEIVKDLIKGETIKIENQDNYLSAALKTAVKNKITIYDALFIELARNTQTQLVTSDHTQAEAARKEGITTKTI